MQRTVQGDRAAPPYPEAAVRPGRRRMARAARALGLTALALVLSCALAFGLLLLVTPSTSNARELASTFDQAHGAAYPGVVVPFRFATSLEATEDHRFASEPGIDPVAVARVLYSYSAGRGDQGGATLYQQLAKMLYTPGKAGLAAEAEQIALAVKLKYTYSEPEILRLYADVAYFGHGYYGLQERELRLLRRPAGPAVLAAGGPACRACPGTDGRRPARPPGGRPGPRAACHRAASCGRRDYPGAR